MQTTVRPAALPQRSQDPKPFGKDVLLRMTALERASQQQRFRAGSSTAPPAAAGLARPPLPPEAPHNVKPAAPSVAPNAARKASTRPISFLASRSSTMPNLSISTARANATSDPAAADDSDDVDEPPSPSICHSPTWSLSANEKNRKTEKRIAKERRKQEERTRKEEMKRLSQITKAGRRLSKKPPAAMDTQRMPVGLARPPESILSTSQGNTSQSGSRPSSSDNKSSPATSVTSANRASEASCRTSSSQPQLQDESTNGQARKPESQAGAAQPSRSAHHAPQWSKSSDEDSAYLKDLSDFAFQINYSAQKAISEKSTPRASPCDAAFPQSTVKAVTTPPMSKHGEFPGPAWKSPDAVPSTMVNLGNPLQGKPVEPLREAKAPSHPYPSFSHLRSQMSYRNRTFDSSQQPSPPFAPPPQNHTFLSQRPAHAEQQVPSPMATSYVHQQRLGRQQRSLAGYQDEMAVAQANEMLFIEASRMPPTPEDSTESLQESGHHDVQPATSPAGRSGVNVAVTHRPGPIPSQPTNTSKPTDQQQPGPSSKAFDPFEARRLALQRLTGPVRSATDPEIPIAASSRVDKSHTSTQPPTTTAAAHPLHPSWKSYQAPSPALQQQTTTISPPIASSPSAPMPQASTAPRGPPQPSELVIEGVNGEGIVRKTSIKRPRSDPELKAVTAAAAADPPPTLPAFDFLPALKHQPLTKPKRASLQPQSQPRVSFAPDVHSGPEGGPRRPQSFAPPASPGLRPSLTPSAHRASFGPGGAPTPSTVPTAGAGAASDRGHGEKRLITPGDALRTKPVAKMFVICCACKFWHDLPSKLYEAMALPRPVHEVGDLLGSGLGGAGEGAGKAGKGKEKEKGKGKKEKRGSVGADDSLAVGTPAAGLAGRVEGKVYTTVRCPWCEHPMSTGCCAGWTTIVYLHERHH